MYNQPYGKRRCDCISYWDARNSDVCPDCGSTSGFVEINADVTCRRCGLVVEERVPDYTMTYADRDRIGSAEDEFTHYPYHKSFTRIDGGSRKMSRLHTQIVSSDARDELDKVIMDYQQELETALCVVHANALLAGRMVRSFRTLDKHSALAKNIALLKAVCAILVSRNGVDHKDVARYFNVSITRKSIDHVMDVLKTDPVMREEMSGVEQNNASGGDDDEIRAIMRIVIPSMELSTIRFKLTQECIGIAQQARVFPALMGSLHKQLAATVVSHVCSINKQSVPDSIIHEFINPATLKKKKALLLKCLKVS